MIKEHKVFYIHGDQHMGGLAATEKAAATLNELSKKGWQAISVSTAESIGTLLLCVAREKKLSNID